MGQLYKDCQGTLVVTFLLRVTSRPNEDENMNPVPSLLSIWTTYST